MQHKVGIHGSKSLHRCQWSTQIAWLHLSLWQVRTQAHQIDFTIWLKCDLSFLWICKTYTDTYIYMVFSATSSFLGDGEKFVNAFWMKEEIKNTLLLTWWWKMRRKKWNVKIRCNWSWERKRCMCWKKIIASSIFEIKVMHTVFTSVFLSQLP